MAAEIFLGPIVEKLLEKLISGSVRHVAGLWKVTTQLDKMSTTLSDIQEVLDDAETQQITNSRIKEWLNKLNHVAYDLEDLVDEFEIESLRREVEAGASTNTNKQVQIQNIIPSSLRPSVVSFKLKIASRLKKINEKLEQIAKERDAYGLSKRFGGDSTTVVRRAPTTSLPDNSPVLGREKEKEELIRKLLQSDEASDDGMPVIVIPIVGMGGVGKTTLARLLYNDERVKKNFNLKAWAYASEEFDLVRVTQSILESFTTNMSHKHEELESSALGAATNKSHHLGNLDPLQVTLGEILGGNKFLLVLDDVWTVKNTDWHDLLKPFSAGASGSKILVTTRNSNFLTMPTDDAYPLKQLTNEDSCSLFLHHAFKNRNRDAYPELKEIGKLIVGKCRGLPLAVITLGQLLQSVVNVNEWEKVLKSEIWTLPTDILPALRLSYFHLPSHLKRCFAYCAIFPKGYKFLPSFLVALWIAEGLVKPEYDKSIEDIGQEYFHELLSRSFFQVSSDDKLYMMHDLIVDLAKFISGEVCFRLDDLKPNQLIEISKNCRHFSYTREFCNTRQKFGAIWNAKRLRTFILLRGGPNVSYIARQVPYDLVSSLQYLRVFILGWCNISELPDSIGNLKHLRYLNLSGTAIKRLPDSICRLHNLQFLLLANCRFLTELPKDMASLTNLHALVTGYCYSLQKMPIGMCRLRNLRELTYFVVGNDSGSSIKDLKDLDLQNFIHLSKLENIIDSRDAREANFRNKLNLEGLKLGWSSDRNEAEVSSRDGKDVLESLEPHEKLESLSIVHYRGREFPSWVGHSSFIALSFLELSNCRECQSLPTLGQLPSLKELRIVGFHKVKRVGPEFYGVDCHEPFRSLEKLTFIDMQEWEEWTGTQELPCLCMLHIERCPKLRRSSQLFPAALDELKIIDCGELVELSRDSSVSHDLLQCKKPKASLVISNCPKLVVFDRRLLQVGKVDLSNCNNEIVMTSDVEISSLTSFRISRIPMLGCLPLWILQFSITLEKLEIDGCNSLTALSQDGFQHLTSLQHLKVSRCPQLTSLLEDEGLPPKLRVLEIEKTAKLEKLPDGLRNLGSLKTLRIDDCPALGFFPEGLLRNTSLEYLRIRKCPSLTAITGGGGASLGLATATSTSVSTSKLRVLIFHDCTNLKSLLEGNNNLTDLECVVIQNCPRIVSLPKGLLSATNLRILRIVDCHSLKSLPNRFHDLTSLYSLAIVRCPISIPAEKWFPNNLRHLELGDDNNLGPLSRLGSHLSELTSLELLVLSKFSSVESFPEMMFPTTLQVLKISGCSNLKYLPKRLHKLTSLEILIIDICPKLAYLPENGLPSSKLGVLGIFDCPLLNLRCQKEKGKDWSKIADIPLVGIDDKKDLISDQFNRKYFQFDNVDSILQQHPYSS